MTTKFFTAILVFIIVSCNNSKTHNEPNQELPKALEGKSSSYETISKRGHEDLIESLYSELVSKDNDLKRLEENIDELNRSKSDSTALFDQFNGKNQSYFSSADRHIGEITDSLVRERLRNLIAIQLAKYKSSTARHNELLTLINGKQTALSDMYHVLKIVRTLPLIDKYQQDNIPAKKPLEDYIKKQDGAIQLADSLSKK